MADPYAEVNRREGRSAMSPLAWFLALSFGAVALGMIGVVAAGLFVARQASEVLADFKEDPVTAFVELADVAAEDIEVVSRSHEDGTVTLRVRDTGDLVTVDLSEVPQMLGQTPDPAVRFDGEADESGGVLTVRTPDGETRIELRAGEDGGFLEISTPDDDFRLGAGGEAGSLPRWVPIHPSARIHKRIFSADTDDGRVGAALLKIDDDPDAVLAWYEETMPGNGFLASVSQTRSDDGEYRGKIEWTSHDGDGERELSVAVGEDDDGDGFLFLLYRD